MFTSLKVTESEGKTDPRQLEYHVTDWEKDFDFSDFSGDSIADFVMRMEADQTLARRFMFSKMGVDMDDEIQM